MHEDTEPLINRSLSNVVFRVRWSVDVDMTDELQYSGRDRAMVDRGHSRQVYDGYKTSVRGLAG